VFVPFGDFCFWQILLQKALPLNRAGALRSLSALQAMPVQFQKPWSNPAP
jgi:hypothetical protein